MNRKCISMDRRVFLKQALGMAGTGLASQHIQAQSNMGRLLIIGGAEDRLQDLQILRDFVAYCGGPKARIRLLTTASSDPSAVWQTYDKAFARLGVGDVAPLSLRNRQDAWSQENSQQIMNADGLFISGGDQSVLMQAIWDTPAYEAIHLAYAQRGCCVAGTSAGAAAMSRHMIAQGPALLRPQKSVIDTTFGLGLLSRAVIDQHFSERRRLARLLSVLAQRPDLMGVGIDEDTALLVRPRHTIEVLGQGMVTLVDASQMRSNVDDVEDQAPLEMLGIELHTLPAGHRYRLDPMDVGRDLPQSLLRLIQLLVEPGPIRI